MSAINASNNFTDSFFVKAVTCVPVIGTIVTVIAESSIVYEHSSRNTSRNRKITLLENLEHFKVASAVRNIISCALIISAVATILYPPAGVALMITIACLHGLLAGKHLYYASKVHQQLKQAQLAP